MLINGPPVSICWLRLVCTTGDGRWGLSHARLGPLSATLSPWVVHWEQWRQEVQVRWRVEETVKLVSPYSKSFFTWRPWAILVIFLMAGMGQGELTACLEWKHLHQKEFRALWSASYHGQEKRRCFFLPLTPASVSTAWTSVRCFLGFIWDAVLWTEGTDLLQEKPWILTFRKVVL